MLNSIGKWCFPPYQQPATVIMACCFVAIGCCGKCSVDGFEYTPEMDVFDLVAVRLLHGWLVDIEDAETVSSGLARRRFLSSLFLYHASFSVPFRSFVLLPLLLLSLACRP